MFLKCYILLIIMFLVKGSTIGTGVKMRRTIQGVGEWYYKILMTLGICKEKLLFSEQQIWGRVRLNRIFDIYYKSGNEDYKVSKVEIKLIVNDSDVMAFSQEGVGQATFMATVFLPLNTFVVFYSLKIFTCSAPINYENQNNFDELGESTDDE